MPAILANALDSGRCTITTTAAMTYICTLHHSQYTQYKMLHRDYDDESVELMDAQQFRLKGSATSAASTGNTPFHSTHIKLTAPKQAPFAIGIHKSAPTFSQQHNQTQLTPRRSSRTAERPTTGPNATCCKSAHTHICDNQQACRVYIDLHRVSLHCETKSSQHDNALTAA